MEDKFDLVYTRFMDSVLALATQLAELEENDLTENEVEFLNAFDEYLETFDEEENN